MNLMIVPRMFVRSSFLISVCMFTVTKALLISSATVIVRAGGAIWLNPFVTVLCVVTSLQSVVYPCLVCLLLCKEEGSSPLYTVFVCHQDVWQCVLCGHQCTSSREHVHVSCFVVRGCAVSNMYIGVGNYDMFSIVHVYLVTIRSSVLCVLIVEGM